MDCGSVSLKMIAKYYDKNFSLDKLCQLTFTGKDSISLFPISETAEQIGFKTVGGKLTFENLCLSLICNEDVFILTFVMLYQVSFIEKGYRNMKPFLNKLSFGIYSLLNLLKINSFILHKYKHNNLLSDFSPITFNNTPDQISF